MKNGIKKTFDDGKTRVAISMVADSSIDAFFGFYHMLFAIAADCLSDMTGLIKKGRVTQPFLQMSLFKNMD